MHGCQCLHMMLVKYGLGSIFLDVFNRACFLLMVLLLAYASHLVQDKNLDIKVLIQNLFCS